MDDGVEYDLRFDVQAPLHIAWLKQLLLANDYRKTSSISRTKSQNLTVSRVVLPLSFTQSIEARCQVKYEDVVGAAPTGDAPTTSEWSTVLLHTKVRLILEVLRYV